ncbi:MAG: 7-cyano-7-deazaguanine synthase [Polyangiaceae bacterium]
MPKVHGERTNKQEVSMSRETVTAHRWIRDDASSDLYTTLEDRGRCYLRRNLRALDQYRSHLQTEEADLLDIASAVFGSDRLARRPNGFTANKLDWARHLQVEVPVRNASFWSDRIVTDGLCQVLKELTDDTWSFTFRESIPSTPSMAQLRFRPAPGGVALFSGGLDSLAGVLHLRQAEKLQRLRLVSVSSNSHIGHLQLETFHALRKSVGGDLEQFSFNINHKYADTQPADPSVANKPSRTLKQQGRRQRARSFFYFVIATILARRTGSDRIYVLENGVTSLNLPISPLLASTRVTRTTHPLVLLSFERFIQSALNWPSFRVELPFLFHTKAQLVKPFAEQYADLIAKTVSCARVLNGPWCGTCTACLLRRQVLWSVGLADLDRGEQPPGGKSLTDIFATFSEPNGKIMRWYFLATLHHVAELLRDPNVVTSNPTVLRAAVGWAGARGLDASSVLSQFVDLHRRYAQEWKDVLRRASQQYSAVRDLLARDTLMESL